MATEIERKFLLKDDSWRSEVKKSVAFRQGYLTALDEKKPGPASVRVRIEGSCANLNIKSVTVGMSRSEYEYSIPLEDAHEMLDTLCVGPLIEKTRHFIPRDGLVWEVDEFSGVNSGLVVAEVELHHGSQSISLPQWIGTEVTEDKKYYNACLVNNPFNVW
ncbi:MAG: CYTH domain-containing protein [bacterium]